MRHDIVQLPRDAHTLLAHLLPGSLGLGLPFALGLLGESCQVPAARRHAVADEPGGDERQEAQYRRFEDQRARDDERRQDQPDAEHAHGHSDRLERPAPRQAERGGVHREPEHQPDRQRSHSDGHRRGRERGGHGEDRDRPAAQQDDRSAGYEEEQHDAPRAAVVHGAGDDHEHCERDTGPEDGGDEPVALCARRDGEPGPRLGLGSWRVAPHVVHRTDGGRAAHRSGG